MTVQHPFPVLLVAVPLSFGALPSPFHVTRCAVSPCSMSSHGLWCGYEIQTCSITVPILLTTRTGPELDPAEYSAGILFINSERGKFLPSLPFQLHGPCPIPSHPPPLIQCGGSRPGGGESVASTRRSRGERCGDTAGVPESGCTPRQPHLPFPGTQANHLSFWIELD